MPALRPLPTDRCPCLSGETYGECCAPFHSGAASAPTAERLMRSRYSAYAVGDADYLRSTWHPSTMPATLELNDEQTWTRLDIIGRTAGGILDTEATVEFIAYYRFDGARYEQHENSRFVRESGRWVYLAPTA
jgi:SEC-C motif-containing protein